MSGASPYPFTSFNFQVALSVPKPDALGVATPLCDGQFSECDGLEMTVEPKTFREGGNNTRQVHLIGPVSYGMLSLKRGMSNQLDLWSWFNAAVGGPASANPRRGALANAVITLLDAAGKPRIIYNVYDCLPIKLKAAPMNAKDGTVAIEEMQIAYSYFTIQQGRG
jgi:phage tail-like protein